LFSSEHLRDLRAAEIEQIIPHLQAGARLLEVGAGTGQQALALRQRGFVVDAIDVPDSNYVAERTFPVVDYDGETIPFADSSFDVVFSSNVLEHVPNLGRMHSEIARVLRPDGYAVHVMPTHGWRFWTTVSSFPVGVQHALALAPQLAPRFPFKASEFKRISKAVYAINWHLLYGFHQRRHGERGNLLSETYLFHPNWWRRNFRENGFALLRDEPLKIFHTGNMVVGSGWSPQTRARLANIFGGACHIFVVRPAKEMTQRGAR
jgi:SAM-dependent methyltransferase